MIWCEHCVWREIGEYDQFWFQPEGPVPGTYPLSRNWNYCPVCATPRPKAQTLADKLKLVSSDWDSHDWHDEYWDILAKTAEEHFKQETSR